MTCKNCGNSFEGKYCNVCGQKASTHRYSWQAILHDLPHTIFHLHDGFLFTIKELVVRPGNMIREYLAGKRIRYSNPFLLLFTIGGVNSFLYAKFHLRELGAGVDVSEMENSSIGMLTAKFFLIRAVLLLPLVAAYCWIIFREKKYSLPEYVVALAYIATVAFLLSIILTPVLLSTVQLAFYQQIRYSVIAVYLAYSFYTFYQFYEVRGNIVLILKILLVIALGTFTFAFFNELLLKPLITQPS